MYPSLMGGYMGHVVSCRAMTKTSLTIIRYPAWAAPAGLLSMALFRLPLWMNRKVTFFKLMGSGKNGTFDKKPDWRQWAIMLVLEDDNQAPTSPREIPLLHQRLFGSFIAGWIRIFRGESFTVMLNPIEGHGTWDGKQVFGQLPPKSGYEGPIAVMTRATIRISRLGYFWRHVAPVAAQMSGAPGFITSFGIGEVPWIKQATFSIWRSKQDMKNFAYGMKEHQEVIRLTRQQQWYSEDMFVRFQITDCIGSLNGREPVPENLYL